MADSPENSKLALQKPSLEAVAKDEERRETAGKNLVRALQSYVNKLPDFRDRDGHSLRLTEIFCDYARENYASRAEPYFEVTQRRDSVVLFGSVELGDIKVLNPKGDLSELGLLSGLQTSADVFELVKNIKVQRPNHWPDPIEYHPDDSPAMRSVLRELTKRKLESFEWLLEKPLDLRFRGQIVECIKECVRDTRAKYERTVDPRRKPTEFPNRAAWLATKLAEREWSTHDLQRHGGPEHRTTQRILDGLNVQDDVLRRVTTGLNSKKTHKGLNLATVVESGIPTD